MNALSPEERQAIDEAVSAGRVGDVIVSDTHRLSRDDFVTAHFAHHQINTDAGPYGE